MKKIINNILHRFKEDSLARRKDNNDRKLEYPERKSIKKCLVFWMADTAEEQWLKALSSAFKEVKIDKLCFVPEEKEVPELPDLVVMKKEDLGFGGKIQNERLLEILGRPYDLLVDLTTVSTVLGNYVLSNNQARCIATMKKENVVGDLIVDGTNDPVDFIGKLNRILSEIKKY